MRLTNAGAALRERRYAHALEKLLVRGDTADVLVNSQTTWVVADTAGRYGPAGADVERRGTERRLDTWVRSGGDWRLRKVTVIGLEVSMGGRLLSKDGKPVGTVPPG